MRSNEKQDSLSLERKIKNEREIYREYESKRERWREEQDKENRRVRIILHLQDIGKHRQKVRLSHIIIIIRCQD